MSIISVERRWRLVFVPASRAQLGKGKMARKYFSTSIVGPLLRRRISITVPERSETNGKFAWRFVAGLAVILAWGATASAQTVVIGTGDPNLDVPTVQAAVDEGGQVVLKGHFSFNRPPTVPTATAFVGGLATVLVSKP